MQYIKLLTNRHFNYLFEEERSFIAGLVLKGSATKCMRKRMLDITNAFVKLTKKTLEVQNIQFSCICHKNMHSIPILLNKSEIKYMKKSIKLFKYTVVVKEIIFKNALIKLVISVVKKKKKNYKKTLNNDTNLLGDEFGS